jgi:hypothetical protein
MVETFETALTPDDIAWFKADFERLINVNPIMRSCNAENSLEHFGASIDIIDQRHEFRADDADNEGHRRMCKILFRYVPSNIDTRRLNVYMAYQRQFLPHQLHVDSAVPGIDMSYAKSAIIPLTENPNGIFKTLIWNKMFLTLNDVQDYIKAFIADKSQFPIVSNVSESYDVDHCWRGTPSLMDTMPLDGVYDYQLGSMVLFDRVHLHCSSNWFKYHQVNYKDIILLHVDMLKTPSFPTV